jgi:hypothetical protein
LVREQDERGYLQRSIATLLARIHQADVEFRTQRSTEHTVISSLMSELQLRGDQILELNGELEYYRSSSELLKVKLDTEHVSCKETISKLQNSLHEVLASHQVLVTEKDTQSDLDRARLKQFETDYEQQRQTFRFLLSSLNEELTVRILQFQEATVVSVYHMAEKKELIDRVTELQSDLDQVHNDAVLASGTAFQWWHKAIELESSIEIFARVTASQHHNESRMWSIRERRLLKSMAARVIQSKWRQFQYSRSVVLLTRQLQDVKAHLTALEFRHTTDRLSLQAQTNLFRQEILLRSLQFNEQNETESEQCLRFEMQLNQKTALLDEALMSVALKEALVSEKDTLLKSQELAINSLKHSISSWKMRVRNLVKNSSARIIQSWWRRWKIPKLVRLATTSRLSSLIISRRVKHAD